MTNYWRFRFNALLARYFQSQYPPLWSRHLLWFIDNLVAFDWREGRNRLANLVEEALR